MTVARVATFVILAFAAGSWAGLATEGSGSEVAEALGARRAQRPEPLGSVAPPAPADRTTRGAATAGSPVAIRGWLYERPAGRSSATLLATFETLAGLRRRVAALGETPRWLVTESQAAPRAGRVLRAGTRVGDTPRGSRKSDWCRLTIIDADTRAPVRSARLELTDRTPFGELDHKGMAHLALPFRGRVSAAGFLSVALRIDPPHTRTTVELRRAAWIRGRVVGAVRGGDVLEAVSYDQTHRDAVTLHGAGEFELGPALPGRVFFRLGSTTGMLRGTFHNARLVPGHNDVGELHVVPQRALRFQVTPVPRTRRIAVLVGLPADMDRRIAIPSSAMRSLPVDASGFGTLRGLRDVEVCATLWSMDGGYAERRDLQPLRPVSSVIRIVFPAPSSLSGQARGLNGDRCRRACKVLVSDARYDMAPSDLLAAFRQQPDLRVRSQQLNLAGTVRFHGLWPIEHRIHVVSEGGIVLGEGTYVARPSGSGFVAIDCVATREIVLRNRSSSTREVALLSKTNATTVLFKIPPMTERSVVVAAGRDYDLVDLMATKHPRRRLESQPRRLRLELPWK